jgi:hypothetical protein
MTALGKILVFINLLFSLVVFGLMIMVYVARTNWYEGYLKKEAQYDVVQKSLETKAQEVQKVQADAEAREKVLKGLVDQGKRQLEAEKAERAKVEVALQEERKKGTGESTSVATLKSEGERREKEVKALEETVKQKDAEIKKLTDEKNDLRDKQVAAQMQSATLQGRVDRMVAQLEELTRENVRLRKTGAVSETSTAARDNPPPQDVQGVIKQTDASGLVTISIGSDAGLVRGHTLDVYRLYPRGQYLGKIRLIDVRATESVGRPVNRMNASIVVGDRVSSNVASKG